MNKPLKIILLVLAALVLLVVGYLAYVLIDYHRLGDMDLEVDRQVLQPAETGREYHLLSYNIGFGAYEPDYGFFMDGGTESWAWSQERLTDNIGHIGSFLSQQHADFYLIQEVDRDSTRSYHVDEAALLREALPEYDGTWAQNYDSPFLMYPLRHPHGASVSGLMTLSSLTVDSARRVELPIENSLMKLVDLDRCYSVHRIPVADGGEGTTDAVVKARNGEIITVPVHGPLMEMEQGFYGRLSDTEAILEMAAASGLPMVPEEKRNPLNTTTYGTGELLKAALDAGYTEIAIARTALPPENLPVVEMNLNRPFLFVIWQGDVPLFIGTVQTLEA